MDDYLSNSDSNSNSSIIPDIVYVGTKGRSTSVLVWELTPLLPIVISLTMRVEDVALRGLGNLADSKVSCPGLSGSSNHSSGMKVSPHIT